MSSSTTAQSTTIAAPSVLTPIPIEFAGPNNTRCTRTHYLGERVRVEFDAQPTPTLTPNTSSDSNTTTASASNAPLSTEEELALTAKATIRYVGPVAAAKDPHAIMIGVEWDDVGRGKNDGSVGGKRYFSCTKGQGSFIHPARIKSKEADALTTAIAQKYETRFKADATTAASLYLVAEYNKQKESLQKKQSLVNNDSTQAPSPTAANAPQRHIPVVFQGEEYMQGRIAQKLQSLIDMTLTQANISRAFDPFLDATEEANLLSTKIPNCQTLDLTDNLFQNWQEVAAIAGCLPKLRLIALSGNNLDWMTLFDRAANDSKESSIPRVLDAKFSNAFQGIQVLVLNSTPNSWETALSLAIANALPQLNELHLCKNKLKSLQSSLISSSSSAPSSFEEQQTILAKAFAQLKTLELSFNELSSWANDIRLFERLPRLECLLLNSNLIEELSYDPPTTNPSSSIWSSTHAPWSNLQSLGLNSNRLSSFDSVHALARFPSLKELRLRDNPNLEEKTMKLNAGSAASTAAIRKVLEADEQSKIIPDGTATASLPTSSGFISTPQSASLFRLQLVARLPRLITVNRSRISLRERGDAERYYLLVAYQVAGQQPEELAKQFPRYAELVAEHGDPAATVSALAKQLVEPTGSTLASKLVELHLILASEGDASASSSATSSTLQLPGLTVLQHQTKKLSSSLTIQAVRTLLEKAFKIPAHAKSKYILQYRETAGSASQGLDEPLKTLNYYSAVNGGCLILLAQGK